MGSVRRDALDILTRVEKEGSYSNLLIDSAIRRSGGGRDAAFLTALVYNVLEHRITLDYFISKYAGRSLSRTKPAVRQILRLGACQLIYLDRVPASAAVNESVRLAKATGCGYASGFVNAVLRRIAENAGHLPYPDKHENLLRYLSVRYSCPEWLVEKWINSYGTAVTEGILGSLTEKPPVVARVNAIRISARKLAEKLRAENIAAEISTTCEDSLELSAVPELRALPSFREGLFILQDYASQLCCLAVNPQAGETIFDMCAAPGGKSFTMGFLMEGKGCIRSFELYEHRVGLIQEGARRLGLDLISACQNDASVPNDKLGLADRVLCDVPCSGLGVIRRKPEIRFKNPEKIDELPNLQYSILYEGAKHVKPGGTLVYSTCTLNPDENEAVAERFLAENPGFLPGSLPDISLFSECGYQKTLFPHINGTDGFFIAVFKRAAGEP